LHLLFIPPILSAISKQIPENTGVIAQNGVQIKRNFLEGQLPIAKEQDRYAAIWIKFGGPAWVARHGLSSAQFFP
jgi:hypothetical protein